MAWHKASIAKFVADQNLAQDVAATINARAEAAAKEFDKAGNMFSGSMLEEVLGSRELAEAYEKAWNENPGKYGAIAVL